jgi:hypothetical protein
MHLLSLTCVYVCVYLTEGEEVTFVVDVFTVVSLYITMIDNRLCSEGSGK